MKKTSKKRRKSRRAHRSVYNGILMHSSWELRFATLADEAGIVWERGDHLKITYFSGKKIHKYHPDFYLPSKKQYIEIKGRWTWSCKRKMRLVEEQNPKLKIKYLNSTKEIDEFIAAFV